MKMNQPIVIRAPLKVKVKVGEQTTKAGQTSKPTEKATEKATAKTNTKSNRESQPTRPTRESN